MAPGATLVSQDAAAPQHDGTNGTSSTKGPSRVRGGSIGQREAESHVPTLKNQGKSDCAVKIIGILESEKDIPVEELSVTNPRRRPCFLLVDSFALPLLLLFVAI